MHQLTDNLAVAIRLTAIRTEVLESLKLFHTHVQYTISLMFAVFAAAAFLIRPEQGTNATVPSNIGSYQTVSAMLLILLLPLGILSILIIGRYYKLYVATLLESSRIHEKYDDITHAWYRQLADYRKKYALENNDDALIIKRTYGFNHNWFLQHF